MVAVAWQPLSSMRLVHRTRILRGFDAAVRDFAQLCPSGLCSKGPTYFLVCDSLEGTKLISQYNSGVLSQDRQVQSRRHTTVPPSIGILKARILIRSLVPCSQLMKQLKCLNFLCLVLSPYLASVPASRRHHLVGNPGCRSSV